MSIDELAGSPVESLTEASGGKISRQFLIPWNQRLQFAQSLVGTGYPGFPQNRVVGIDIQPWNENMVPEGVVNNASTATATYGQQPALITVEYGPDFTRKTWPTALPKPAFKTGTELRYRLGSSAQFLLIPSGGAIWESDETSIENSDQNRKLVPIREIEIQWDFVDNPPLDRLDGLVGGVNKTAFLGGEPETILFENYTVEESFRASASNPHTNKLVLCMRKRRIEENGTVYGWNHDWRASPQGWDKVFMGNEPRYLLKELGTMFT